MEVEAFEFARVWEIVDSNLDDLIAVEPYYFFQNPIHGSGSTPPAPSTWSLKNTAQRAKKKLATRLNFRRPIARATPVLLTKKGPWGRGHSRAKPAVAIALNSSHKLRYPSSQEIISRHSTRWALWCLELPAS